MSRQVKNIRTKKNPQNKLRQFRWNSFYVLGMSFEVIRRELNQEAFFRSHLSPTKLDFVRIVYSFAKFVWEKWYFDFHLGTTTNVIRNINFVYLTCFSVGFPNQYLDLCARWVVVFRIIRVMFCGSIDLFLSWQVSELFC